MIIINKIKKFEKIEILKSQLQQKINKKIFASSKINQLDAAIEVHKKKFEYRKKLFNEQIVRFQKLEQKSSKEIESIESKLAELEDTISGLFICPYCSKEYQQQYHYNNHIVKCKEDQADVIQKEAEIIKLKEQLASLEALKELDKEEGAEIVEEQLEVESEETGE